MTETAIATGAARDRDYAEYGLCGFLALTGLVVLFDAARLSNNTTGVDPLGPKPVPLLVGGALDRPGGRACGRGDARQPR